MGAFDDIILRTALIDARRYVARGMSVEDAARLSCSGAWQPYRTAVESRLRTERDSAATEQAA